MKKIILLLTLIFSCSCFAKASDYLIPEPRFSDWLNLMGTTYKLRGKLFIIVDQKKLYLHFKH